MKRLFLDDGAQGAAEYAIIAAVVAIVAIGALLFFGEIFGASLEHSAGAVGGASGSAQLP